MLGGESILRIHELRAQGKGIREISRITGRARNTVRRYLRDRTLLGPRHRVPRGSKLDPFKAWLNQRIGEGVMNCTVLLRELRQRGYQGGKTLVKDYVRPFRPPRRSKATVMFHVVPGQQAQVDFGVFRYEDGQGRRTVHAFVMVLSHSRAMYVEFTHDQTLPTLQRCLMNGFEALGGMTREVLLDNLKPVVRGYREGRPEYNERFLDFALRVGFMPRACRPYRARTKGRVERAIGYIRDSFWPGLKFTDLDDLNRQARTWCEKVANVRTHAVTGRRPVDMLAEEGLSPLPARRQWEPLIVSTHRVDRYGFVRYQGSLYGVPWQFAGQDVGIRERAGMVELFTTAGRAAVHPRAFTPGQRLPCPGQWTGLIDGDTRRNRAVARRVPSVEVQERALAVYESLCGGGRG